MDTFDAINRRRSVKAHDPIHRLTTTEETKLLEAAIQSPTSFNMQKWRFVVVRDPELQRRIRAAAADQAQVTDPSPAVIPHLWHPLLRIRQGTLYVVRAGFCRGLLVQGPRRLSLLQRPPDGTDSCASRRPRHFPSAHAAVGDFGAKAAQRIPCRPACGRRRLADLLPLPRKHRHQVQPPHPRRPSSALVSTHIGIRAEPVHSLLYVL